MANFFGTNGDDALNGTAGADTFFTRQGGDNVEAGAGDDVIIVESGAGTGLNADDLINGEEGTDTVELEGSIDDYEISFNISGQLVLTGKPGTLYDGEAEVLVDIELIVFSDQVMRVVDAASTAGSYFTIQSAVDASMAGDQVVIMAGIYAESVTIDKALSLVGQGVNDVTIGSTAVGINVTGDINNGGSETVSISGINFTNHSVGVRAHSSTVLSSLVIDNASFTGNTTHAVGTSAADGLESITITNSTFQDNGQGGSNGAADIQLFDYHGDVTIEDVTITSTRAEGDPTETKADYAIQIAGFDQATYDVDEAMGNVSLENVTITGAFHKNALSIQGFTDLTGFSATNVNITGTSEWGILVFVDPVGSSGQDAVGNPGYHGNFNTTADDASIDLSGITVTNNSSNDVGFDVFVRGSSADDVQIGTNARDALNQMAELNTDYGGNDSLEGRGGDDILFGGLGNDHLDGGDDLDVAIFSGNRDDYTIVETGLGTYSVTDNNAADGDEGTDTLTGIELVQFSDQTLELDANSPDTSGYTERFSQSFDDDSDGFFAPTGYGNIALVASGTDGISSSDGTGHAVFTQSGVPGDESGPYSRMDAYRSEWLGGFTTSLDIYLDDTKILAGEGFDVSFAANGTDGSHEQDFIFHITHDTSTGDMLIGASNNSNFAPREDLDTLDNHAEASSAGWYTFSWNFYENPLGDLEVAMNVHDESGNWVFTEIRSDLSNDVGTVVGGNRYMWFTNIDVAGGVAVDNVSFSTFDASPVQLIDGATNSITSSHATIADAVAVAASGDTVMISAGDYSGESPVNVSVEDLTFRADAGATGISVQLTGLVSDVSLEGEGDINVTGNAEDNTVAGNEGDNVIDGADGVDTAVYAGNVGDYTITSTTNAAGLVTGFTATTDNNAADGDDGTDTLVSVEALEFADVSLDLSLGVQLFNSAGSLIGTFATLQEAVDAAAGGADETIRVAAGSYAETVNVNKTLTILGANAGIAHDGTRGAESALTGAFQISADNVTVDGFAVNEGATILGQITAFYVGANDVSVANTTFARTGPVDFDASRAVLTEYTPTTGNGLSVTDSSFSGFHTGLYVNTGDGITVSGNLFDGNMVGISNDDPDNFNVTGNTFQNQVSGDIGVGVVDATEDLSTQILNDNTILGTEPDIGIYSLGNTDKSITGTDYADSFNGGTGNETFTGGAGDDEFDGGDGIDTAVFSGNYADYTLDFSTGTIDGPDGSDSFEDIEVFQFDDQSVHVVGTGGYATIQDAVDAASAGDTIIVMSGFYTETVEVDKTLTIVGEEGGIGPATGPVLGAPIGGDPVLNGAFHITADNVTIDGFEVTGGASILGQLTTVYVQGLNATITGSTLTRSGSTATFDGSRGIVTEVGNTGDGLTVHDSTIIGFHTGLYVNSGVGITVSSSFFRENMVGISNDDPDDFLVTSSFFQNQLFEGIGLGVVDATENLLLQIRADNSFTGTAPEVSIYPLAAASQDIIGTSHDDVFYGTAQDQIFDGQGGDDSIIGGAGNDELKGGTGDDTMIGGEGDDIYDVDSVGDVVTEAAGEGTDAVHSWIDDYTLGSNVENGFVEVSGHKMTGNALDNTLTAVASGGILFGRGGDDTLMGSAGEDTLYAGSGIDLLMGGEGNDQYDVRKTGDAINDTGTSTNDVVKSSVIDLDLNTYTGVEKAAAKGGLDLALTGDAADNTLNGNSGANVIQGGGGRDILRGGGGDDVFVFTSVSDSAAGSADRIKDFEQGVVGDPGDLIDLFGIDAVEGGRNNAFTFIGNDAFSSTAGELRYENVTASFGDATYVFADVNGDGNADFRILLDGFFTLEDADFIL
ncbi:hypothetical protein [Rhodalgimonas zhirmunskyi]|uniref:Uncharacterized protein n=1 Tax=Rhodalgimonas zhirmunskyi TaxID=2964767 RepID=A0AAJ1UAY2_9RHOB|nr:hypothetical protein [Rhodoalgimonas zhirmunskyi]MDQ2092912.1 hypothetical protein [Rhodoalgimonas zhirmunskyi]